MQWDYTPPPIIKLFRGRPFLIVRDKHEHQDAIPMTYPGESLTNAMKDWTYQKRSSFSSIKLMPRITRANTSANLYCSPFFLSRDI